MRFAEQPWPRWSGSSRRGSAQVRRRAAGIGWPLKDGDTELWDAGSGQVPSSLPRRGCSVRPAFCSCPAGRPRCNEAVAVPSSTPLRCGCFQLSGPFVPRPGRVPLSATSSHCPGPVECKSSRAWGKRRFPASARSQHGATASMQTGPIGSHPMALHAVSPRPPVTAGCCGDCSQSSTAPLRAPTCGAGEEGPPCPSLLGTPLFRPYMGCGIKEGSSRRNGFVSVLPDGTSGLWRSVHSEPY